MSKKDRQKLVQQHKQYIKNVNKFVDQIHEWDFADKFGIVKLPEKEVSSDESSESESEVDVKILKVEHHLIFLHKIFFLQLILLYSIH